MMTTPPAVGCAALFKGFFAIGIRGFGGVLPIARHQLVEVRGWLDERAFLEVLGLGQLLPGPNIVNVAILVGARFAGARGALAAFSGLMLAPFCIVLALAELYARAGQGPQAHALFGGVAVAAAGLVLATGGRLALKLERRVWSWGLMAATFIAVGVLRLPLLGTLAVLLPLGLAAGWWASRVR